MYTAPKRRSNQKISLLFLQKDMPCMSCTRIKSEVLIKQNYFNHSTLWAYSADNKLIKFFLFFQKTGFGISHKLSPLETTCMKCQILFSRKNKENISKCRLLKILPRVPPVVVSADDKLIKFFLFFQKTRFGISCKLSPLETICMKCQILFSRKNKKNISKCCLLKILPRVPPVVVSADDKLIKFFLFFQKTGFGISCKLSPLETIRMKCQILFSRKNKKNISKCHLLKILPRVPPAVVSADCSKVVLLLQFFSLCMPVIATAIVSCHCLFLNSSSCGASRKTASWLCPFLGNLSLFVLRFYGPVNPMGSCRAWSVYLTTRLFTGQA